MPFSEKNGQVLLLRQGFLAVDFALCSPKGVSLFNGVPGRLDTAPASPAYALPSRELLHGLDRMMDSAAVAIGFLRHDGLSV